MKNPHNFSCEFRSIRAKNPEIILRNERARFLVCEPRAMSEEQKIMSHEQRVGIKKRKFGRVCWMIDKVTVIEGL